MIDLLIIMAVICAVGTVSAWGISRYEEWSFRRTVDHANERMEIEECIASAERQMREWMTQQ
jgi:hypothetical protein